MLERSLRFGHCSEDGFPFMLRGWPSADQQGGVIARFTQPVHRLAEGLLESVGPYLLGE